MFVEEHDLITDVTAIIAIILLLNGFIFILIDMIVCIQSDSSYYFRC